MNTLLLDLFGTIIPCPTRKGHRNMIESMADLADLEPDPFENLWIHTYSERIRGVGGTSKGFIEHILRRSKMDIDEATLTEMASVWDNYTRSLFRFFPDVKPALKELKGRGIKIGLLTNCGANVPLIFSSSDIAPIFDSFTYSSTSGFVKPQKDFYFKALEDIGSRFSETVFLGDGDNGELPGARKVGILPVKIDRGVEKGDYRIIDEEPWDPTITTLNEIGRFFSPLS